MVGCDVKSGEAPRTVEWAENASVYEVNIRQYTPEGTFQAFRKHLPRLKELGWIFFGLCRLLRFPKRTGKERSEAIMPCRITGK